LYELLIASLFKVSPKNSGRCNFRLLQHHLRKRRALKIQSLKTAFTHCGH
jgi:hypothetical protein